LRSIPDLVRACSFIFSGTVLELGASSVPIVAPHERLITVRLDEGLRIDPVLGDLRGSTVTVAVGSADHFETGQQAIFFANSAVHGRGIVVHEVAHVDPKQADVVTGAVAELPRRHLISRLQDSTAVVDATVTHIDPPGFTFDQHDGLWAAAHLQVTATLKGTAPSPPILYFATAEWPPYDKMPRFEPGQAGIFILQLPAIEMTEGGTLPEGSLVAVDGADYQPRSESARVKRVLAALK
jgi:hypothetical protein